MQHVVDSPRISRHTKSRTMSGREHQSGGHEVHVEVEGVDERHVRVAEAAATHALEESVAVERISNIHHDIEALEAQLADAVHDARRLHVPWRVIGEAAELNHSTALRKWREPDEG